MKRKYVVTLGLVLMLVISGCGAKESAKDSENAEQTEESTNTTEEISTEDMFTNRDMNMDYDESKSAKIQLNGDSADCSSDAVQINGSTVTITDEGTYIISGTLKDGMIIVNAEENDKPQLVFDGVTINSESSAPLYIIEADKVVVTLAPDSENTLSNGGTFTAIDENNIDAAIFSKADLSLNGSGSLNVISPSGHGIVSKDDLVLAGGIYIIESSSHGLDANDSVRIVNTELTVDAGNDGIHAENTDDAELGFVYVESGTISIVAEGDGVSSGTYMQIEDGTFTIESTDDAIHSDTSVFINGGIFEIACGDDGFHADETMSVSEGIINITKSYEGIEGLDIKISGGDIKIVSSDDGINAAGGTDGSGFGGPNGDEQFGRAGGMKSGGMGLGENSASDGTIVISGGNIYMNASGDGIDANGSLEINGGTTVVCGPTMGDTAVLDYDTTAVISGGTFIGTGSTMMAQTFSESKQGVVALSVGNQTAGTQIVLEDTDGNTVMTAEPILDYQIVILSSPDIVKGETYKITVGSSSGEFEAN